MPLAWSGITAAGGRWAAHVTAVAGGRQFIEGTAAEAEYMRWLGRRVTALGDRDASNLVVMCEGMLEVVVEELDAGVVDINKEE